MTKIKKSKVSLELDGQFPLRPIRSEVKLDQAIAMVNILIDRKKLSPDEEDYLDVLGDLIEKYENQKHPIPRVSDREMLKYLIQSREIDQNRFSSETGICESTISSILIGKRVMNRCHIEVFARYFKVDPGVFLHV